MTKIYKEGKNIAQLLNEALANNNEKYLMFVLETLKPQNFTKYGQKIDAKDTKGNTILKQLLSYKGALDKEKIRLIVSYSVKITEDESELEEIMKIAIISEKYDFINYLYEGDKDKINKVVDDKQLVEYCFKRELPNVIYQVSMITFINIPNFKALCILFSNGAAITREQFIKLLEFIDGKYELVKAVVTGQKDKAALYQIIKQEFEKYPNLLYYISTDYLYSKGKIEIIEIIIDEFFKSNEVEKLVDLLQQPYDDKYLTNKIYPNFLYYIARNYLYIYDELEVIEKILNVFAKSNKFDKLAEFILQEFVEKRRNDGDTNFVEIKFSNLLYYFCGETGNSSSELIVIKIMDVFAKNNKIDKLFEVMQKGIPNYGNFLQYIFDFAVVNEKPITIIEEIIAIFVENNGTDKLIELMSQEFVIKADGFPNLLFALLSYLCDVKKDFELIINLACIIIDKVELSENFLNQKIFGLFQGKHDVNIKVLLNDIILPNSEQKIAAKAKLLNKLKVKYPRIFA